MTAAQPADVVKDSSMLKQKEMISGNYRRLETAAADGRKVASTFVPGNLNELIMCFDMLNNLPEINAIQNGLRKKTGGYIMEAEKRGHSEDVCTYVKADLGSIAKGNIGPDGQQLPDPDLLLLSYTGCFTFMKWFELLREHYKCETAMLHVPYQGDGKISGNMIAYVVKQLREEVIPKLERVSGVNSTSTGYARTWRARPAPRRISSGCWNRRNRNRRRSMRISAVSTISDRSSPHSAAPKTPSTTTGCCARKSPSGWRAGRGR